MNPFKHTHIFELTSIDLNTLGLLFDSKLKWSSMKITMPLKSSENFVFTSKSHGNKTGVA